MELVIWLCGVFMVAIFFGGVYLALEPDPQDKKVGACMALWALFALYLFFAQWLFVPRHEPVSLYAITILSTAGYIVGKTWAWLTRWEWIEEP